MVVVGTGMKIFQKLQAIPYVLLFVFLNFLHFFAFIISVVALMTIDIFQFSTSLHPLFYTLPASYKHFYIIKMSFYSAKTNNRMYNYPTSLNLIQNFVYVPLCFMYIIPVSRLGLFNNSIPNEVTLMSKRPFVISEL